MPQEPHRATARCLDILEYLAAAGAGCTLTELSEALGAPKSSLFPILHTLAARKYVHLEDGKYTVGIGAFTLGATYSAGRDALELILTVMAQVVEECQETCQLAVRDQGNVLYIGKVDSPQAIRMISHVGTRLPANATALGKALLSGLTDQEVAALYSGGLPRSPSTRLPICLSCWGSCLKFGGAESPGNARSPTINWDATRYRCGKRGRCLPPSVSRFPCFAAIRIRSVPSGRVCFGPRLTLSGWPRRRAST